MADDIGGVWRTIGGRRVFIKDGQDLASAMKESGKFNDKKQIKDEDISPELKEYIKDYTDGEYRTAVMYTEYIQKGLPEEEALKKTRKYAGYINREYREMTDEEFKQNIKKAKELSKAIENQKETDKLLVRFEKTQTDENYRDMQHKYKEGEKITWGIKSTSQDENFISRIAEGKDVIKASNEDSAYPYTYTEYRIIGNKKALDISKYSVYPEQKEALVQGEFVVKKVENIKNIKEPSNFGKSFEEYRFYHKDRFEDFTSKKGKKMIRDKQTGKTYSQEQYNTGYFTNDGKYMNYSDFNILLEEKRPKGLSRQIVTIEQI